MDKIETELLNLIQGDFPLEERPYLKIGKQLGISEVEVIELIRNLKEKGFIRRIGGLFNSKELGYVSTLCAMKVGESEIEAVARIVNSYSGVTHNYIRDHSYNMWFTLTAESEERIQSILKEIQVKTGLSIMHLTSTKTYKIKVNLCL